MKNLLFNFRKASPAHHLSHDEAEQKTSLFAVREEASEGGNQLPFEGKGGFQNWYERLPIKVLIADDTEINQKLLGRTMERLGYECTIVSSGQEAYDAVMRDNFQLILMDLYMPGMDGCESAALINEDLEDEAPLIVAVTASIFDEEEKRCEESGIVQIITKPFRVEDLEACLVKWEDELRLRIKE